MAGETSSNTERVARALIARARNTTGTLPPYLAHHLPQHISASRSWGEFTQDRTFLEKLDPDDLAETLIRDVFGTPEFDGELQVAVCVRPYLRTDADNSLARDLTAARLGHPTHRWTIGGNPPPLVPSIPLVGHSSGLTGGVFSPDGVRILSTGSDWTARLWDSVAGECVRLLMGHSAGLTGGIFNSVGSQVVTTSLDGTARVWDTEKGECLHVLKGHSGGISAGVFSPDGSRVLTTSADGTARLWGVETGECFWELRGHRKWVRGGVFSPDGLRVLTTSADGSARLWDTDAGVCGGVLLGHSDEVQAGVFSPDGLRVLTTSRDKAARLWDASPRGRLRVLTWNSSEVAASAFSKGGSRVLNPARFSVSGGVFSPNNSLVLTASFGGTVRLWDTVTGKCVGVLEEVDGGVFSQDGLHVLGIGARDSLCVWSCAKAELVAKYSLAGLVPREVSVDSSWAFLGVGCGFISLKWKELICPQ